MTAQARAVVDQLRPAVGPDSPDVDFYAELPEGGGLWCNLAQGTFTYVAPGALA